MKSKEKFYKKWGKARSKGIFKYLLKDLIFYILIIVIGILLGTPIIILARSVFFHEDIIFALDKTLNNMRNINLIRVFIIIPVIIVFINILAWSINEKKYKRINHLKDEDTSSKVSYS